MFSFLAIGILLFTSLIMVFVYLIRKNFSFFWLIAVVGSMTSWLLVLLDGFQLPQTVMLYKWSTLGILSDSLVLTINQVSWPFALALETLVLTMILTSASGAQPVDWRALAGSLSMTAIGLLSVLAGNPLSLLMGWVALDMVEAAILLVQIDKNETRQKVVISFGTRIAGVICLLFSMLLSKTSGSSLTFTTITPQICIYLLLAVGLRLGVLPLHIPFFQEVPKRQGLGTILRLVPASVSLVLLVHIAKVGIPALFVPYFLGFTFLATVYGGWRWARATDELSGRPYWVLCTASFATAAAIRSQPTTTLAWALVCLFCGGMLFLTSVRHRNLLPIMLLGILGVTNLPFSQSWNGAGLYAYPILPGAPSQAYQFNRLDTYILFVFPFLFAQAILLAGYTRHSLRIVESRINLERWVWVIYTIGLTLLPLIHSILSWRYKSSWEDMPLSAWWSGFVVCGLGSLLWFWIKKDQTVPNVFIFLQERIFPFNWIYQLIRFVSRMIGGILNIFSNILEGEAGILWALVLFALVFTFLIK